MERVCCVFRWRTYLVTKSASPQCVCECSGVNVLVARSFAHREAAAWRPCDCEPSAVRSAAAAAIAGAQPTERAVASCDTGALHRALTCVGVCGVLACHSPKRSRALICVSHARVPKSGHGAGSRQRAARGLD
eukprot:3344072-Pleurochrysis_carterae.AAC.1